MLDSSLFDVNMPVIFKKFEKRHHFLLPLPLVRLGKQVLPSGLLTSFNVLIRTFVHCHLPVYLEKIVQDTFHELFAHYNELAY